MDIGDVFLWDTENVTGYQRRLKYHVFIRSGDWNYDNTFLFVNKADYGGDHPLRNAPPHGFLPLPMSYVGCGAIVQYDDDDLQEFSDEPVGRLSDACLRAVSSRIQLNTQMPGGDKKIVLAALHEYLKNRP